MTEYNEGQCMCDDCQKERLNLQKHLEHPFYKEVSDYVKKTEHEQIVKGSEKYAEPFKPDSWTNEELSDHAMQENRDQAVYITGMRDRMRKQELTIKYLEGVMHSIAHHNVNAIPPQAIKKTAADALEVVADARKGKRIYEKV